MKKLCPTCNRLMDNLFFSISCGWCDFELDPKIQLWTCYTVVDKYTVENKQITSSYLFKYFKDASLFKETFGAVDDQVWEAACFRFIDFRYQSGLPYQLSAALMSDAVYRIYHDHRFEQKDKEAFLIKRMD